MGVVLMSNFPFEAHENVSNYRSGIYAIVNIANGKLYIGSAVRLKQRKYMHTSLLKKNAHHSIHLQRSYNKWGESYFVFKVVEYCSEDDLIKREQYYIDSFERKQLYNIYLTAGSPLGTRLSEERKIKISKFMSERNSKEEYIQKNIENGKKRFLTNDGRKQILSALDKGRDLAVAACSIPIIGTHKKTKEEIIFASMSDAAKVLGRDASSIQASLRGKSKSSAGYTFELID